MFLNVFEHVNSHARLIIECPLTAPIFVPVFGFRCFMYNALTMINFSMSLQLSMVRQLKSYEKPQRSLIAAQPVNQVFDGLRYRCVKMTANLIDRGAFTSCSGCTTMNV